MAKPLSREDYLLLASATGFEWLGSDPVKSVEKTRWRCPQGHVIELSHNSLKRGIRCAQCSGKVPKRSIDYAMLAFANGITWVGTFPKDTDSKTDWQCEFGHVWSTSYQYIKSGKLCQVCRQRELADSLRAKPSDYHALAKSKGVEWIGNAVKTANDKTLWRCCKGHEWLSTYSYIKSGNGCPQCKDFVNGNRTSPQQKAVCETVNGILNVKFGSRKCIDIVITVNDIPIAIEYDGWYWHGNREHEDSKRDTELLAAGYKILHIRSNELIPTKRQITSALKQLTTCDVTYLTLEDWGVGNTFDDRKHRRGNNIL